VNVADVEPTSLTHQHLLAAVRTELSGSDRRVFRLLDVGCGSGELMSFLETGLGRTDAGCDVEVHGFDVHDFETPHADFPATTIKRLSSELPDVPWHERVRCVSRKERWPYADECFDVVVSNQVMEHVLDLGLFMDQLARVMRPGGRSVHVFPLRNSLFDGHVRMPLVHRVHGFEQRAAMTGVWARLGFGTRPAAQRIGDYAYHVSDYLHLATIYRPFQEFVYESKRVRLRASYRYTPEFYLQKLSSMLSGRRLDSYRRSRRPLIDMIAFCALRHISSVTLVLEKPEIGP
jgi:SAM-dependent methyltransferase